jgi:hypothetical protein
MIELKYIWKLVEAKRAKEQGGFFNRIFVILARKSLRKRLKRMEGENMHEDYLAFYRREILDL